MMPAKRQEAIRLALWMNKKFFIERMAAGIDTTPAYERVAEKASSAGRLPSCMEWMRCIG